MKNLIFLTLFAFFLVFSSLQGQLNILNKDVVDTPPSGQWEILNEGGDIETIDFVNNQVGWIAGENTLIKTEDGGETWVSIVSNCDIHQL